MTLPTSTSGRKAKHIEICLQEDVQGKRITNGLEAYRFRHAALPEIDFESISTETALLGKRLKAPFLVSSMTGGTERAESVNRRLAIAAQEHGWAMGLGSLRAAVEHTELAGSFQVRRYAPDILLIANLGAVQLNYGFGVEQCRRAVEMVEADALVLHLNSLQEIFQPEGNTNFSGLLRKIEELCKGLNVPVGLKEVGWGIDGDTAARLVNAGAAFIDVAGAGGTSWSEVEKHRIQDESMRQAAETFAEWGTPTAECVLDVRAKLPQADCALIASGGIHNGLEAAKAIALGADVAGFGRSLLQSAVDSYDSVDKLFRKLNFELRAAMFGTGSRTVAELKEHLVSAK